MARTVPLVQGGVKHQRPAGPQGLGQPRWHGIWPLLRLVAARLAGTLGRAQGLPRRRHATHLVSGLRAGGLPARVTGPGMLARRQWDLAVQRLIVLPIRRVAQHMAAYAEAPEDARRVIAPMAQVEELREAEEAMQAMQRQLTGSLKQKERLAQLGGAVAKISHDLRNILTSAQLFADRLEGSADPMVARSAPKLVGSISRAVALCESTLKFGKAEEVAPAIRAIDLAALVSDVAEAEGLDEDGTVACLIEVPDGFQIMADAEQLYRVLSNLVRNARQAIEATGEGGTIEISASETADEWRIRVGDTGPGLPEKAREHLFEAFQGGARKGGTGLGLAIAAELLRGHGGRLELARSDAEGTEFLIHLPKSAVAA